MEGLNLKTTLQEEALGKGDEKNICELIYFNIMEVVEDYGLEYKKINLILKFWFKNLN